MLEGSIALLRNDTLTINDIPGKIRRQKDVKAQNIPKLAGKTISEVEKQLIFDTLDEVNGNRTKAAKMLGINVRTLQRKLAGYGISEIEV